MCVCVSGIYIYISGRGLRDGRESGGAVRKEKTRTRTSLDSRRFVSGNQRAAGFSFKKRLRAALVAAARAESLLSDRIGRNEPTDEPLRDALKSGKSLSALHHSRSLEINYIFITRLKCKRHFPRHSSILYGRYNRFTLALTLITIITIIRLYRYM